MRYVTITTWELVDGADFGIMLRQVKEKRLPALKELGAERVTVMRTSERTFAAISEWPDKQHRDEAAAAIERVRAKVRAEDHTRMTGETTGEVVADI